MSTRTNSGTGVAAAGSPFTIPFTVIAGRSLIVIVNHETALTGLNTFTNNNTAQTWIDDDPATATDPNGLGRRVYRCAAVTGTPPTTVTCSSAAGTLHYTIVEATDLHASPFVGIQYKNEASNRTSHSETFTSTNANDMAIVLVTGNTDLGTITPSTGFTEIPSARNARAAFYKEDLGIAGSQTLAYTSSGSSTSNHLIAVYKSAVTDPTVTSVTSTATPEGGSTVHTVTLSGPTNRDTAYAYAWSGGATGADYDQTITTAMCARTGGASGNVTVSGSNITAETGVSAFTITVPTTQDALDEDNETIVLTVGGVASTGGSITDDDALPSIVMPAPVTVDGGDSVVLPFTLPVVSGRVAQARLVLADGTKVGGVDYTNVITNGMLSDGVTISAGVLSIPAGVVSFTITIPTTP